jgi:bisphosphoglycerate-dependent phosphoglycerate mutase
MAKLILLRHGESVWNKKNVFSGWGDVPLSPDVIIEVIKAGECLKDTVERTILFLKEHILSQPEQGKNVLVSTHGNSLRSLVMYIEKNTKEGVPGSCRLAERGYGITGCGKRNQNTESHFGTG